MIDQYYGHPMKTNTYKPSYFCQILMDLHMFSIDQHWDILCCPLSTSYNSRKSPPTTVNFINPSLMLDIHIQPHSAMVKLSQIKATHMKSSQVN